MDMTAYFLGRAASGGSGGGISVQPDYLQNDPSAKDYIKNRPFYSEKFYDKYIVPLQEVQFTKEDNIPEGTYMTTVQVDESKAAITNKGQYNLIIDDKTYLITVENRPDMNSPNNFFYFGNFGMISSDFTDTGEDYVGYIVVDEEVLGLILILKTSVLTHKVGISYIGNTVPFIVEDEYDFSTEATVATGNTIYIQIWEDAIETLKPQVTDEFNVKFNGETYNNLILKQDETFVYYLGNSSICGIAPDTGEDWVALFDNGFLIIGTRTGTGPHTLSIEKSSLPFSEVIHKIDSKYLDIDIDVEVPYTEDSSGNVTFKGDVNTSKGASLDAIKSDLTTLKSDLEANKPVQSDYLQNDSTAKDYIKNRPFYFEVKAIDPITQTIYDSINSDSPNASYDTINTTYISVVETDGTFEDYIISGSDITITQKITVVGSKSTSYYNITRTGDAVCNGNIIYVGNLYLSTQNNDDNTSEDYLFYYDGNTDQLSLYFLNTAKCDDGTALSSRAKYLNSVGLTISVYTDHENIYHKIDPNYLPDIPYTSDGEGNTVFEGTITAKKFILSSGEEDEEEDRTSQTYIILTDIEDGLDYAVQMKGGSLVTSQLPLEIRVTTPPNKTTYYRGEYLDLTGMIVTAIYPDDNTKIVEDYTTSYDNVPLNTVGENEIIIKAKMPNLYTTSIIITVNEFEPETMLVDFDYTANNDGTYTLTGWKETLNGESSTELIIPNHSLIVL